MLKAKIEIPTDFYGLANKESLVLETEGNCSLIHPGNLSWVLNYGQELGRRYNSEFPGNENSLYKKPSLKEFHDLSKGKRK